MKERDVLMALGLASKEAQVYVASLELGASPVSEIALKAKLNRVTCYDILERLGQKGFVSSYTQNKVKFFTATDPDVLRDVYRQRYNDFKAALPDLRRLHGKTPLPRVRYYEGVEGIKRVYADSFLAKTEILNYAASQTIREYWPTYDEDYVKERVRRKIRLRGIAPDDEAGRKIQANSKKLYREIRLVPATQFNLSNEINIYNDTVSIVSFSKDALIGMIIESPEIADTQRAIFKMAWEFAGRQGTGLTFWKS